MIKRFKLLIASVLSGLTLLLPATLAPALVHADTTPITQGVGCGVQLRFKTTGTCTDSGPNAETSVNNIVKLVINIFSIVVGLIAVIMIIVGGIRFILSGGDSTQASSARNTVIYAIVGLVVVALAQILVRYVFQRVTNATTG